MNTKPLLIAFLLARLTASALSFCESLEGGSDAQSGSGAGSGGSRTASVELRAVLSGKRITLKPGEPDIALHPPIVKSALIPARIARNASISSNDV